MFNWFNGTADFYSVVDSIAANFMIFYNNFLYSLIMKAWVTCALDETCIAANGTRLAPCCGCHRYDQSAITIILSHFFHTPKAERSLRAFSIGVSETFYFYTINRRHGMDYFT